MADWIKKGAKANSGKPGRKDAPDKTGKESRPVDVPSRKSRLPYKSRKD